MADPTRHSGIPSGSPSGASFIRGDDYLLAIAIDEYDKEKPLNNCVRDVTRLVNVLKNQYGLLEKNITPLYNKDARPAI